MMKKNYCSFSPDKVFGIYLGTVCLMHDLAYKRGGSELDRWRVDKAFRLRLAEKNKVLAWTYYVPVALFGWIFFNYRGARR